MDNDKMVIQKMKNYMLKENISACRMAKLCGIDRGTISRILNRDEYSLQELTKIKILSVVDRHDD